MFPRFRLRLNPLVVALVIIPIAVGTVAGEDLSLDDVGLADELSEARILTNLNDEVYRYLQIWEDKGYLSRPLPYLRPYPQQVVESALRDVAARGTSGDAARAEAYLKQFADVGDSGLRLQLRGHHHSQFHATKADHFGVTGTTVEAAGFLLDDLSIAGAVGMYVVDEEVRREDAFPYNERTRYDYMRDDSQVGVRGRDLLVGPGVQGMVAYGSDSIYFQAGLARNTYGPFYEGGIIMSENAPHTGQYSFTFRSDRFTYQHSLMSLTATKDDGSHWDPDEGYQRDGVLMYPDKYLAFHALTFHLLDWLDVSLHESITFGERFDPIYLLPTSVLIYNQIYYGEKDTAFIGFGVNARLPNNFAASTNVYIGDLSFNDMLRGEFDTKYKAAWQLGGRWNPDESRIERVSADYSMVLPYTYTHRRKQQADRAYHVDDDTVRDRPQINYQNYTHHGQHIADMDPNSDRVRLRTDVRLNRFMTVDLHTTFHRHANATPDGAYDDESWSQIGTSDGSLLDSGNKSDENLFDELNFLNQDVIERILQLGFDARIKLPVTVEWLRQTEGAAGVFGFDFGYTFEYGWNRRPRGGYTEEFAGDPQDPERTWVNRPVPEKGNDGVRHYGRVGISLSY